jgi:hypothetical protein
MTSRRKLLIVAAVLLVAIVLLKPNASLHLVKDEANTITSSGYTASSQSDGDPDTCSRFVIVLPEARGRARDMQDRVARELKSALAEKYLAYTVPPKPFPPNSRSQIRGDSSSRIPEVFVCSSKEEALRQKPDMLVFVRCSKWQCSFWPFVKSYSAEVDVKGGEPSYWHDKAASSPGEERENATFVSGWPQQNRKRFLTYSFNVHVMKDGKMRGLFTGGYLASSIAQSVAKTVADTMEKQLREQVQDYVSEKRKKARQGDPT